ncbi:MAG: phosphotransferase [Paenibacillaceae bacterium]|nr:phosphotransferase [Paenibacillaceae bacterium]
MQLADLHAHMPPLRLATAVAPISKGFSSDGKYLIYEDGITPVYVLRTAALDQTERKRREYETVCRVHGLGVRTSQPVAFGTAQALGCCFMVLRYVEGEDAAERLPLLSEDEQHRIGLEAGRELRLMHEMEAPAELASWSARRKEKHRRQWDHYLRCGVKLPQQEAIADFIEQRLPLMDGRPNRFQHDDFHPANLIVQGGAYAAAIDFNRFDWGDPYHDFVKIAYFSREVSVPFSIGQIDGYFAGKVPHDFWDLYALYAALLMGGTITWTLQVVPDQLESMIARIRTVLDDHRHFASVEPLWYKQRG